MHTTACHPDNGGAKFLRNVAILHSDRREKLKSYNCYISLRVLFEWHEGGTAYEFSKIRKTDTVAGVRP
jgi:hypothetical protein